MKRLFKPFLLISFLLQSPLFSGSISVSGNPTGLTINSATAGQNPNTVTNDSTNYNLFNFGGQGLIIGRLSSNMPPNTSLQISLEAPNNATSLGFVNMSTVNTNLVTGIPFFVFQNGLSITYSFSATAAAQPVNGATVVTFTLQ